MSRLLTPDPGSVGLWRLNEQAIGNGIDFLNGRDAVNNGASPISVSGEHFSYARQFSGSQDMSVPHNTALDPGSITVECWVNFSSFTPATSHRILAKRRTSSPYNQGYNLYRSGGSTGIWWDVWDSGNNVVSTNFSESLITLSQWHYIVGIYNQSDAILFLDGVEQDRTAATSGGAMAGSTAPLTFGSWNSGDYLLGNLAEIMVSDYAKTPGQIAQNWNAVAETAAGFEVE